MTRIYQLTGLAFLALAGFIGAEAIGLRYYSSLGPGPGFFPLWLAVLLGMLSLGILYQASFKPPEPKPADLVATRVGYLRIIGVLVAIAAVVLLMEPLGFRLTMLGFYLFLLVVLGGHSVPLSVAVALAGSFGCYHLFVEWLNVPLPVGWLGV